MDSSKEIYLLQRSRNQELLETCREKVVVVANSSAIFVCSSFFCTARMADEELQGKDQHRGNCGAFAWLRNRAFRAACFSVCARLPPRLALTPPRPLAVPPSPLRADPIYLKPQSVGDIKVGGYSMCKGFPCKVRARLAALAAKRCPPLSTPRVWVSAAASHATPARARPPRLLRPQIRDYSTAKTGKHGSAKAMYCGIDIFSGKRYDDGGASPSCARSRRQAGRGGAQRAQGLARVLAPSAFRPTTRPLLARACRPDEQHDLGADWCAAALSRGAPLLARAPPRFFNRLPPRRPPPAPCLRAAVERKEYQIMDLNDRDVNEKGAIVSICDEAGETVDDLRVPIEGEEKAECVGCGPPPPHCGAVARACPVWPAALRLPRPPSPSRAARCPPFPAGTCRWSRPSRRTWPAAARTST